MYPLFSACVKLKPVCLLLCLCHAGSAAAFGLGDISVRSFLGQPLHATVSLLDITPATAADCFSLDASPASIAPLPRAQLSIEQSGAQTLLHIRTRCSHCHFRKTYIKQGKKGSGTGIKLTLLELCPTVLIK